MMIPSTDAEARDLIRMAYQRVHELRNQRVYLESCMKETERDLAAFQTVIEELNQWRRRQRH